MIRIPIYRVDLDQDNHYHTFFDSKPLTHPAKHIGTIVTSQSCGVNRNAGGDLHTVPLVIWGPDRAVYTADAAMAHAQAHDPEKRRGLNFEPWEGE